MLRRFARKESWPTQKMEFSEKTEAKGGKGIKEVVKKLDNVNAQPITYLQRDQAGKKGQAPGTITTDPEEIDGIVRRAWRKIYAGTKDDAHKAAAQFVAKYAKYIYKGPEEILPRITGEDVRKACKAASKTAGGMDGCWA